MPRGCKAVNPKTTEMQISEIDAEIEHYKQKIAEAKERKRVLLERKEKEDLTALYEAVKASGKTPEELLKTLQQQTAKAV